MRSQPVAYIEPTLRAGWSGVRISAVARGFSLTKTSRWALGPTKLPIQCARGYFLGGGDVDHSPSSNAEVRNEWSYTYALLYAFLEWTGTTFPFT